MASHSIVSRLWRLRQFALQFVTLLGRTNLPAKTVDGKEFIFRQLCNYTLPSGSVATTGKYSSSDVIDFLLGFVSIPGNGGYYNNSQPGHAYIANFDLFGASYNFYVDALKLSEFLSIECALWMCVQTYKAESYGGEHYETVIATESELLIASINQQDIIFPLSANKDNVTYFGLTDTAQYGLEVSLTAVLKEKVDLTASAQDVDDNLIREIWNATTHIDAWIANLATSITNVVCTTNTTSRPEYNGSAVQLGVGVRWVWLTLPVVLVFLSLALLVAVIVQTANSPVKAWKESPLMFLLLDMHHETRALVFG